MCGLVDWLSITDRTRFLRTNTHWTNPQEIINASATSFYMDRWRLQNHRPEVWVEKDALVGVIASICEPQDVPYFACRGYGSQSEMWLAAMRIKRYIRDGFKPVIFHLGDHDPSGIDMTRDVTERLYTFVGQPVRVRRLALNWDQIQQYQPPPNPTKLTDSRAGSYIENYGESSWELDALSPSQIAALIEDALADIRNDDMWDEAERQERVHKEQLQKAADLWPRISKGLDKMPARKGSGVQNEDGSTEYDFGEDEGG